MFVTLLHGVQFSLWIVVDAAVQQHGFELHSVEREERTSLVSSSPLEVEPSEQGQNSQSTRTCSVLVSAIVLQLILFVHTNTSYSGSAATLSGKLRFEVG